MFVLYEVRVQATVLGVSDQLSGSTARVTVAWIGHCLVNNASLVLGLSNCVAYERIPWIVRCRSW
jgi:hypothetical protein